MYRSGYAPSEARMIPLQQAYVIQNAELDKGQVKAARTLARLGDRSGMASRLLYPTADLTDAMVSPFEHEVCVVKRTPGGTSSVNELHDISVQGITCANVVTLPVNLVTDTGLRLTDKERFQVVRDIVREEYRFGGIVNKGTDLVEGNTLRGQETGFTLQRGGTCETINWGHEDILPGQAVVWDFPTDEDIRNHEGMPGNKHYFALRPFDPTHYNLHRQMVTYLMQDSSVAVDATEQAFTGLDRDGKTGTYPTLALLKGILKQSKAVEDTFLYFLAHMPGGRAARFKSGRVERTVAELDAKGKSKLELCFHIYRKLCDEPVNRIIGRAMTPASPGAHFTIHLGSGCTVG